MTLTDRERLALQMAARGFVSGSLAEWPEPVGAFVVAGVPLPVDAGLVAMKAAAREALARGRVESCA